jgi:tripartite-type tricarboxylate transporter receptor subunit TctC
VNVARAVARLNAGITQALDLPDVRETLLKAGLEPTTMKHDEMQRFVISELANEERGQSRRHQVP